MTLLSVGAKLDFATLSGDVNSVLLFDFWTTGVQSLVGTWSGVRDVKQFQNHCFKLENKETKKQKTYVNAVVWRYRVGKHL